MFRRLSTLSAVSLGLLVGLSGFATLSAYSLNGYKWGTSQVQYFVNPQSQDLSSSEVVAAVQRAADVWNTQSNANVTLQYAGTTNGSSLTLNYKNEVFFRNEASGNTAATYWWYSSGTLVDADIVFYDGHQWFAGGNGCSNGYYVENTGAHEFGHALGLGHSEFDTATMWGSTYGCMTDKQTLAQDDLDAIERLYPPVSGGGTPAAPPSAPANLTANPASSSSIALSWGASGGSDGYRVERSPDGVSFTEIRQLGGGSVSYTDSGLTASTTYYYRVKAFNGAGSSTYSNLAAGTTPAATTTTSAPNSKKGGGNKRR